MCVIAATALAFATRQVKAVSAGGNLLMVVGLQMLVGSALLALAALAFETPRFDLTPQLVVTLTYQIFIPGLTATMVWFALVGRVGAIRASTFHFLNPFFGVVIAAVLLGEHITVTDIIEFPGDPNKVEASLLNEAGGGSWMDSAVLTLADDGRTLRFDYPDGSVAVWNRCD